MAKYNLDNSNFPCIEERRPIYYRTLAWVEPDNSLKDFNLLKIEISQNAPTEDEKRQGSEQTFKFKLIFENDFFINFKLLTIYQVNALKNALVEFCKY